VFGNHGEVGADLRFGNPQTVRRWFGKPVVGDARQFVVDGRRSGIRFSQRPEAKVDACEECDDRRKRPQRQDAVAATWRAHPSAAPGDIVQRLHLAIRVEGMEPLGRLECAYLKGGDERDE
jgi:hypothetical protein